MEQCKITVNKNNGMISLKGVRNKRQFKQDDTVIVMLKSEYDDLIGSNDGFKDVEKIHKHDVAPADVQTDLYDGMYDASVDKELYHLNKINEMLENKNKLLIDEIDGLKSNLAESDKYLTLYEVLKSEHESTKVDLKFYKLMYVELLNRKFWDRVRNNVPNIDVNDV